MPDGTKKRVRRRIIIVKVVKKPKGGDDEKSPIEEEPVQYEEVDIDEANPEDEKYDPKVLFYSITIKQTDLTFFISHSTTNHSLLCKFGTIQVYLKNDMYILTINLTWIS